MFSNQERQIFNSILHFSDFNSINVFTRVNFNGLMKWEIFCIFFWYVLEFIVIFFILNKSYFANSSNKLVHRISEMKSANLVFIKINNNFSQLFFSQICFDISLLLHSIDLRFIVEICTYQFQSNCPNQVVEFIVEAKYFNDYLKLNFLIFMNL